MPAQDLTFRTAGPEDAHAVAELHADSWQRHYRGAYSDAFLDAEPSGHLARLWTERLATPSPRAHTVLAEHDGELVGLAHALLDEDPTWGTLVDNLHVTHKLKRRGIGTHLLALTASAVRRRSASSGLYLWVLEQNTAAQTFYSSRGGTPGERAPVPPPGGNHTRLKGRPTCLRYAWRDLSTLLQTRNHAAESRPDTKTPLNRDP